MTAPGPLTVYYNTKCPVCGAGIALQRNVLVGAARSGVIVFRDINAEPDALRSYDVSLNVYMEKMAVGDRFADLLYAWNRSRGHW